MTSLNSSQPYIENWFLSEPELCSGFALMELGRLTEAREHFFSSQDQMGSQISLAKNYLFCHEFGLSAKCLDRAFDLILQSQSNIPWLISYYQTFAHIHCMTDSALCLSYSLASALLARALNEEVLAIKGFFEFLIMARKFNGYSEVDFKALTQVIPENFHHLQSDLDLWERAFRKEIHLMKVPLALREISLQSNFKVAAPIPTEIPPMKIWNHIKKIKDYSHHLQLDLTSMTFTVLQTADETSGVHFEGAI